MLNKVLFVFTLNFTNIEPCNSSKVLQQNIWKNSSICIGNDVIYKNYKDWVNAGITSIKDIFNSTNCSFMKREELERIYNINISVMKYNQIISAIPRKWKTLLQTPSLTNVVSSDRTPYKCFSNIQLKITKSINSLLPKRLLSVEINGLNVTLFLNVLIGKKIYMLCFKTVKDIYTDYAVQNSTSSL